MMLQDFLPQIFERTRSGRVLDVGGAVRPLNTATHILDVLPPDALEASLCQQEPTRYSHSSFVEHDLCTAPWPFPDNHFDYAFCAQTLTRPRGA